MDILGSCGCCSCCGLENLCPCGKCGIVIGGCVLIGGCIALGPMLGPTCMMMANSSRSAQNVFRTPLPLAAPPQLMMSEKDVLMDYARIQHVQSLRLKKEYEVTYNGKHHVSRKPWIITSKPAGDSIMRVEEGEKTWLFNHHRNFSFNVKLQDPSAPDIRCRRQVDTTCYLHHQPEVTIMRGETVLAYVLDPISPVTPSFMIYDAQRNEMLSMKVDATSRLGVGPLRLTTQRKFEIRNTNGVPVCSVTKKRDEYEINFLSKCTLKQKEVILAHVLYLVMFYVPNA